MGDKGCETGIGVDCDDVNSGVWGISWFESDAHLIFTIRLKKSYV